MNNLVKKHMHAAGCKAQTHVDQKRKAKTCRQTSKKQIKLFNY